MHHVKVILSAAVALGLLLGCASLNRYPVSGALDLKALEAPVRVLRDEKGMAYLHAATLADAFRAMGFVTAQDRLFQMELTRMLAAGRIAEMAGPEALPLDRRMRTIGIYRIARRHARLLPEDAGACFRHYIEGVNAFVAEHSADHHLEFKLAGIRPSIWTLTDVLAVFYYMSWSTSANIQTEVITQMLVERLGPAKAQTLLPLNLNPDEPESLAAPPVSLTALRTATGNRQALALFGYLENGVLSVGSNNWAAGPALSPRGQPILANDTHLDARILPGPWYPCGIVTPELRIVGAHIPGLPVMPIFRNEAVAAGITNAYGDVQDLYIETLDPTDHSRYLEGDRSVPFEILQETLRYKDAAAPGGFGEEPLTIRLTRRGPIISRVFDALETRHVLSLRWAAAEVPDPAGDVVGVMRSRSAEEFREALRHWQSIVLNFVFVDRDGNIGWQVSGALPVRTARSGMAPYPVGDGSDNWLGWIPFEAMPRDRNPDKGWLGTCNHKAVSSDYPYYYSSYFASSYRYRRLKSLLDDRANIRAEDHWRFQRDTYNMMAESLAPIMAKVLIANQDTRDMGAILAQWDFDDSVHQTAPTLFHAIYNRWAFLTFRDELGAPLALNMLDTWYFWQERFQHMVQQGRSPWFDDLATPDVRETMEDILCRAAREMRLELTARLGDDMDLWRWGRVHTITFVSPIRRSGLGQGLLGGGRHPMGGSGETLRRGQYAFQQPFEVKFSAALRMVADLGDPDKVLAVIPGGISGRLFHPHAKDQVASFIGGDKQYWWFSDQAIADHARSELVLIP